MHDSVAALYATPQRFWYRVSGQWVCGQMLHPDYRDNTIPKNILDSLTEASRCLENGAFTASVGMSGRALEGLVRHFITAKVYLGPGLRELHKQGMINDQFFAWTETLRLDRNYAVHSSGQTFNAKEATTHLAHATFLCEYVFVNIPQITCVAMENPNRGL